MTSVKKRVIGDKGFKATTLNCAAAFDPTNSQLEKMKLQVELAAGEKK